MNRLHGVLVIFIISVTIAYFAPNVTNTNIFSPYHTESSHQSPLLQEETAPKELEEITKRRATMKRLRTEAHLNMDHAQQNALTKK